MTTNRFEEMKQVHRRYFPHYQKAVSQFNGDINVKNMLDQFVLKQVGSKFGARAYLLEKMYRMVGGKKDITTILAATEMHVASMYCFNVAADEKSGFTSNKEKKTAYKTRHVAYELAKKLISSSNISSDKKELVLEIFENTEIYFYLGQIIDTQLNLITKNETQDKTKFIESLLNNPDFQSKYGIEKDFANKNLNRILTGTNELIWIRTYLINAHMIRNLSNIINALKATDNEKLNALAKYGSFYGISMQISNDIQDYVLDRAGKDPTREKKKKDVFNDLKHGKINWPLYFGIKKDKKLLKMFQQQNLASQRVEKFEKVRDKLAEISAFRISILESSSYSRLAINSLKSFAREHNKLMLKDLAYSIGNLSKYFRHLEDIYKIDLSTSKKEVKKNMARVAEKYNQDYCKLLNSIGIQAKEV